MQIWNKAAPIWDGSSTSEDDALSSQGAKGLCCDCNYFSAIFGCFSGVEWTKERVAAPAAAAAHCFMQHQQQQVKGYGLLL